MEHLLIYDISGAQLNCRADQIWSSSNTCDLGSMSEASEAGKYYVDWAEALPAWSWGDLAGHALAR